MNENGYNYVHAPAGLIADAEHFPPSTSKSFYMLTQVGGGTAGYTHLACNTDGKLAAIKLYATPWPSEATLAEKWEECEEEMQLWKTLLPKYGVFKSTLNMLPALVLPYCQEIKPEDRDKATEEIEAELKRYAKAGWKYAGEYLLWRHVLRDNEGILILGDLHSLDDISNEDSDAIENVVSRQIENLKERIDEESLHSSSVDDANA